MLAALVVDGYLLAEDAKQVRMGARAGRSTVELHPLVLIANAKLPNQREPGRPLGLEALTEWLASHAGLPYLKIDPMRINVASVTQTVSIAYAQRHRILPVAASAERDHLCHLRAVRRRLGARPVADAAARREAGGRPARWTSTATCRSSTASSARSSWPRMPRRRATTARAVINFEQLVELGKTGEVGADDRHVVHIVDWLLQYAFEQRASDIHLEPRREAGHMRFRIDGVMHKVFELPPPVMTAVTSRIKILARMDVAEKRRPQDGRIKTRSASRREVELRISTMPTAFGEKLVMRIFDPDIVVQELRPARLFRRPRTRAGAPWSSGRTASCWSPARPVRARPPRCIPR